LAAKNRQLDHIRNGDGYRGLSLEMRVASLLHNHGWKATHGAYYVDPLSDPPVERELDVAATRSWRRKRDGLIIRLHLLVECKSLSGRNVLCAATERMENRLYHQWLGEDDDELRAGLLDVLASCGLPQAEAREALERFKRVTFPGGKSAVAQLFAPPPKAPVHASSAKDAVGERSGGEKEPLWQAMQVVFAAMNGTTRQELGMLLSELHNHLTGGGVDVETAVEALENGAMSLDLFHPIVVTEASLFMLSGTGALKPTRWCRLEHSRISSEHRWFDLVSFEGFDGYAAQVTRAYEVFFKRSCTPA
jgi:hypothetical protein